MAELGTGKDMLHIPFGEMIASIAMGVADAQQRLDQTSMNVAELMGGQRILRSIETGEPILKADGVETLVDSRVYFGHVQEDRGSGGYAVAILNDAVGKVTEIKILRGGEKHNNASRNYSVEIEGGEGTGAKGEVEIDLGTGAVTKIEITESGAGYVYPPEVKIRGLGRGKKSDAILEAVIKPQGGIGDIELIDAGEGYDEIPRVNIIGEGYGAEAKAIIDQNTRKIKEIQIVKAGGGYQPESTTIEIIPQKKLVPQKLSMIELGFTPNFYHFVDTVINMKVALRISRVGKEYKVHSAPVDGYYASAYNYNLEASASVQTKIVPIPPPTILEERIRAMTGINITEED